MTKKEEKPVSYNYKVQHCAGNHTAGNTGRKYIVIHYTGNNTDTAQANANYFAGGDRGASAHLFVDQSNVVEVVDLNNTAWAVGRNFGGRLYGTVTNSNSISIEMCSNNGKIADQTFMNTVDLTKKLMAKYGIGIDNVVRHYDVCAKQCPGWAGWLPNDERLWNEFKAQVKKGGTTSTTTTTQSTQKEETSMQCFFTAKGDKVWGGGICYFDGYGVKTLTSMDEYNVLNDIYKKNNGKDMPSYSWSTSAPYYVHLIKVCQRNYSAVAKK